jgi:hypothetical protein
MVAQWVANVVDFRDRDSIMTACEFDLNPWNGWDVDGNVFTSESLLEGTPQVQMRFKCWGTERPELLISETMATHDRRTQDLSTEDAGADTPGRMSDGDSDFDSHLVPSVSAFFELYNPWVINDANQVRPPELYDDNLDGVVLQRTSPDGSSPIWRMVVVDEGEELLDPDNAANNESSTAVTETRRIYFAKPAFHVDHGPEVYYPDEDIEAGFVAPGKYAMVGTAGRKVGDRYDTYFGRRLTPDPLTDDELENKTRRISLDPTNSILEINQWQKNDSKMTVELDDEPPREQRLGVVCLPIGLNDGGWERELGISDPIDGYWSQTGSGGFNIELEPVADGLKFVEYNTTPGTPMDYAFDEPIDRKLDQDNYDRYLKNDGLVAKDSSLDPEDPRAPYRIVHLQRLANPLLPFNNLTNPYMTIDSCGIDLFAFNGVTTATDSNNVPGIMRFGTHERRGSPDSDYGQTTERDRLLFKSDLHGAQDPVEVSGNSFSQGDNHILSWNLVETFGGLNQAYKDSQASTELVPFGSLTWNNRPFVSQLELANVPHTSSYWLTRSFDISSKPADRDLFNPQSETDANADKPDRESKNYSSHYPYLLNFHADSVDGSANGPSMHHLFDFLEVPSRFIGTESYVNPATFDNDLHSVSFGLAAPFDKVSNYRYPGKININTVLDPTIWNGLMGGTMGSYATDAFDPVTYPDWEASRHGGSTSFNYANPYRPSRASNLVPFSPVGTSNQLVVDPVECGLFRSDGTNPLLDYDIDDASSPFISDDRAAYFRNDMRQRLGNLVTSRSSVFAIWISVGYFEVNPDGSLKPGPDDEGVEAGAETGEVRRSRAFFMVDRSIPVAFEPGVNHNVDRAVLVKSIIE